MTRGQLARAWTRRLGLALLPALLVSAVLALFFAPALRGDVQFLGQDNGRVYHPVKQYLAERLRRGELPQWNPYNGLGQPLLGGAADAVQHPFTLLLLGLPFEAAFKAWAFLSYLLAGLGAYAWTRQLGRGAVGATAAGLGFVLTGYLVSSGDNYQYLTAVAGLPLLFAAAHAHAARGGAPRLACVGLSAGLCAAAGDPLSFGIAACSLPLYGALVAAEPGRRGEGARRGTGALAAALAGAAPFLAPVAAWIGSSSRGDALDRVEVLRWSLAPMRLMELVAPHVLSGGAGQAPVFAVYGGDGGMMMPWVASVYLGAAAVALAVVGATADRRARVLLLGAAAATWMALGHHAGFGQLARLLPVTASLRYWEKMVAWPALLVPAAAAFGVEALARPAVARRVGMAVAALGAALLAGAAVLAAIPERIAAHLSRPPPEFIADVLSPSDVAAAARGLTANLSRGFVHAGIVLLALGLVALLTLRGRPRLACGLAAAVLVLDLFAANGGACSLQAREPQRPTALTSFLQSLPEMPVVVTPFPARDPGAGPTDRARDERDLLYPEHNTAAHVRNVDPYAGMTADRMMRFIRRSMGLARQTPRLGLWGVAYAVLPMPDAGAATAPRLPYLPALRDPELRADLVSLPHRPRAYLAGALASVDRRAAMEFALSADPTRGGSVVEGPVPSGYAPPSGEARVTRDEPERVEVETASSGPALLVLNDTYAPGWSAEVDGRRARILPTNYLVRGVWVEPGRHRVTFTYRTPGLVAGWSIFAAAALCLLAYPLATSPRRRRAGVVQVREPERPAAAD